MGDDAAPVLKFVTGANAKYFFMFGILKESLARFLPGFPLFVMDFGFSPAQRRILSDLGMLLPLPDGLDYGMHPFTLKSSLDLYVAGRPGPWVWIDADILAVGEAGSQVRQLCSQFRKDGIRVALAEDRGQDRTLGDFARRYQTPKLQSRIEAAPGLRDSPYLNTGLVFFMEDALLPDWRTLSAALHPDVLWEQNALNILAHDAGPAVRVLDPRVWNAQGELIDALEAGPAGVTCDGQSTAFIHATSPNPAHLAEFEFPVLVESEKVSGFVRLFARPDLTRIQTDLLAAFLQRHPGLKAA